VNEIYKRSRFAESEAERDAERAMIKIEMYEKLGSTNNYKKLGSAKTYKRHVGQF